MTMVTDGGTEQDCVVELAGEKDMRSFLVPAYGFEDLQVAHHYITGRWLADAGLSRLSDAFGLVTTRDRKSYLPRACVDHYRWHTTQLVGHTATPGDERPVYPVLRATDTPMPPTAYNVALLVEGRREYFRYYHDTTEHPKWWRRIAEGRRECFAVWEQMDGSRFNNPIIADGPTRVCAARSGRGVIYARETLFDEHGAVDELRKNRTEVLCVEFSILNRDPAKDDVMRLQISAECAWSGELDFNRLGRAWRELALQARAKFDRYCKPIPLKQEAWRVWFLDQRARADADRCVYAGSFDERITGKDWQSALRCVDHAWQLEVVLQRYAHARLDDRASRYGKGSGVDILLSAHECSDERYAELCEMVADYVAPNDNL